ncbi:uncharacterized protein K452DRAFT_306868 [Aplosporella prunicola CBS 121167]|uniref:Clr5 domain-containing protein n=1 Tax=Aplosporella prunicola CBS 121167 TaxID=1176127 RepID=A0A6A6BN69_9PEZI|nr:uncharacterized protein K452DRAFT_306868 [Aplosporella prunicola CBS 121167]KAF2144277.1 hypothetical protein K452DRAFT_306868 [Aplosporella prunicola CBS 121167]
MHTLQCRVQLLSGTKKYAYVHSPTKPVRLSRMVRAASRSRVVIGSWSRLFYWDRNWDGDRLFGDQVTGKLCFCQRSVPTWLYDRAKVMPLSIRISSPGNKFLFIPKPRLLSPKHLLPFLMNMTKDWDDVQQDIRRYYVDDGLPLTEVSQNLKKRGFEASERAYRNKIQQWGFKRPKHKHRTLRHSNSAFSLPPETLDNTNNSRSTSAEEIHGAYAKEVENFMSNLLDSIRENNATAIKIALNGSNKHIVNVLIPATVLSRQKISMPHISARVGDRLLNWATASSSLESLDALLEAGAQVNAEDSSGYSAIHVCVMAEASPATLEKLLAYGASIKKLVSKGHDEGKNALEMALSLRCQRYGLDNHDTISGIVTMLLSKYARDEYHNSGLFNQNWSDTFIEPWFTKSAWWRYLNDKDLQSFLILVRGNHLQLRMPFKQSSCLGNGVKTLLHELVHHTPGSQWAERLIDFLGFRTRFSRELLQTLVHDCKSRQEITKGKTVPDLIGQLFENPDLSLQRGQDGSSLLSTFFVTITMDRIQAQESLKKILNLPTVYSKIRHERVLIYAATELYKRSQGPDSYQHAFELAETLLSHLRFAISTCGDERCWDCLLRSFLPITSNFYFYMPTTLVNKRTDNENTFEYRFTKVSSKEVAEFYTKAAFSVSSKMFLEEQAELFPTSLSLDMVHKVLKMREVLGLPDDCTSKQLVFNILDHTFKLQASIDTWSTHVVQYIPRQPPMLVLPPLDGSDQHASQQTASLLVSQSRIQFHKLTAFSVKPTTFPNTQIMGFVKDP